VGETLAGGPASSVRPDTVAVSTAVEAVYERENGAESLLVYSSRRSSSASVASRSAFRGTTVRWCIPNVGRRRFVLMDVTRRYTH
jgi:hypothetical protein